MRMYRTRYEYEDTSTTNSVLDALIRSLNRNYVLAVYDGAFCGTGYCVL